MTIDEKLKQFQNKRIAVLGLGVSNRPLVKLLLSAGCTVTGCDRVAREKLDAEVLELEKLGCTLSLGDTYLDNVEADILFRTPVDSLTASELMSLDGAILTGPDLAHDGALRTVIAYYLYYR